jgi:hypothetical protein
MASPRFENNSTRVSNQNSETNMKTREKYNVCERKKRW